MLAAYRDHVEVIAQLLEAGANADLQSTKVYAHVHCTLKELSHGFIRIIMHFVLCEC